MDEKKGFGGLDSLTVDIDEILNNTQSEQNSKDSIDEVEASKDSAFFDDKNDQDESDLAFWIIASVFILLIVLIVSNLIHNIGGFDEKYYDNRYVTNSRNDQKYEPEYKQQHQYQPQKQDYYEIKPDISVQVLNANQLLYCLSEEVRLNSVNSKKFKHKSDIDLYNKLVNDFSDRCSNKQYYKDDLSNIQIVVSNNKYKLEQEGKNRFNKSEPEPKTENLYSLTIMPTPSDARVRILNIKPKYHNGIKLKKGKYHIEVSKNGYDTVKSWIELTKDSEYKIKLNKLPVPISEPPKQQPKIPNRDYNIQQEQKEVGKPDMSRLSQYERSSIENVCGGKNILYGPAAYYQCLREQIDKLGY